MKILIVILGLFTLFFGLDVLKASVTNGTFTLETLATQFNGLIQGIYNTVKAILDAFQWFIDLF